MKVGRILPFLLAATCAALIWLWHSNTPAGHLARDLLARQFPAIERRLRDLPARTLEERLAQRGFTLGQSVLIRIYKEEGMLELWMERGGRYELAMNYPVCAWSGELGPKLREGDGQAPEGYYFASAAQLKPDSSYHRAINVGFPNAYDRQLERTGSFLMIHGNCVSIGCYAMTDAGIDDIYQAVERAMLKGQQAVAIHLLPFRLTPEGLARHDASEWQGFWKNLAEGDRLFVATGRPPAISACGGKYYFSSDPAGLPQAPGCQLVAAW